MSVRFLLVTCCLEQSRAELLSNVVLNLREQCPDASKIITVFDNASTVDGVKKLLVDNFETVWQSQTNVGYWSAIDWWLSSLAAYDDQPKYTYIIESDMIHYAFHRIDDCVKYLDDNPDVGSVRLHEYSVENRHLFNKDSPRHDSNRSLWQSHINKVTGKQVKLDHSSGDIWSTTFLTQLPALNRFQTMLEVFNELRQRKRFSELDFQSLYWKHHQHTAILDGGIFHCNLNPYGAKGVTGSWTNEEELKRLGYQATRFASITPTNQYNVIRL